VRDRPLVAALDPIAACAALRHPGRPTLLLDGRGRHDGSWTTTLSLEPEIFVSVPGSGEAVRSALARVDAEALRRRKRGGPGGTGLAVAISYEATGAPPSRDDSPWSLLALSVDTSVRWHERAARTAGRGPAVERAARLLGERIPTPEPWIPCAGAPRTSLPRVGTPRAVSRVKDHIARGDIYQANLTQRLEAPWRGDPIALYRALAAATPAPRSAFLEAGGMALASVSPEVFIDVDRDGRASTWPIKGTRARRTEPEADRAAAAELLASEKDRAELTMIVDLERNDLGRIARPGSVRVGPLPELRSYPAVHHLVARVDARLREGVGLAGLVAAAFPGGSITGAPKIRAMEILREVEPAARGLYTGSLFWLDDDGSTASSILIRSIVVISGQVRIGGGGGVVADSDPESEWMEANAKVRALTRVLGFEPEEAS
jgi:anthranilate/para-aminobenzoate synthase component I